MRDRFSRFVQELRRRKVIQVTSLYVVLAWGASLGGAELLPAFGVPDWVVRAMVISFLLLLPIVIFLSWHFDLSTKIVRDPFDVEQDIQKRFATTVFDPRATSVVEISWEGKEGRIQKIFSNSLRIGREAQCDVSTLDKLASRQHAEIGHDGDVWWIQDLRSRNGTFLDGARITRAELPHRCIVSLGENGQKFDVQIFNQSSKITSVGGGQIEPPDEPNKDIT